jgi:ABC-2 type transport system permease protein
VLILSDLTDPLPDSWGRQINAWMPTNAGQLIMHARRAPHDLLHAWQALAVLARWTALLLIIAAVLFVERDA